MEEHKIIPLIRNEKINKRINKYIWAIHDDISYKRGGWLFLFSRLIWNSMILYYMMGFLKAFFFFSFKAQEIIPPEKYVEIVGTLLWAIGIIYIVLQIGNLPTIRKGKEG